MNCQLMMSLICLLPTHVSQLNIDFFNFNIDLASIYHKEHRIRLVRVGQVCMEDEFWTEKNNLPI